MLDVALQETMTDLKGAQNDTDMSISYHRNELIRVAFKQV